MATQTNTIAPENSESNASKPELGNDGETIQTTNGFYAQKTYTLASTQEQRPYKSSITDEERPDTLSDMRRDLEDTTLSEKDRIYAQTFASIGRLNRHLVDASIRADFEAMMIELSGIRNVESTGDWKYRLRPLLKKYKALGQPKKAAMRRMYMSLLRKNKITANAQLEAYLITKASRTKSGVMVVTVLTSPYPAVEFSHFRFQKILGTI